MRMVIFLIVLCGCSKKIEYKKTDDIPRHDECVRESKSYNEVHPCGSSH